MMAIISFFAGAVNHFIKGPAGTLYVTRPVAIQCLRLAELIKGCPVELFYLHIQPTQPISAFCPNFHFKFTMVYILLNNSHSFLSIPIYHNLVI